MKIGFYLELVYLLILTFIAYKMVVYYMEVSCLDCGVVGPGGYSYVPGIVVVLAICSWVSFFVGLKRWRIGGE